MARPTSLKSGRKPLSGRPSLAIASPEHRQLTSHEVTVERLALSIDLLDLVVDDAALPAELQGRVRILCAGVRAVWGELRQRP